MRVRNRPRTRRDRDSDCGADRRRASVEGVAPGAAVLPVAADRALGAGETALVEEVLADALDAGGLARDPHACRGVDVGRGDRGLEGGTWRRRRGEVVPGNGGDRGAAGSSNRASGRATSRRTATRAVGGRASRSTLIAGSAVSSPASRWCSADGSTVYPRPVPETAATAPGSTVSAHVESGPSPWSTTSTSSSGGSARNRRGVSVRNAGRVPSGSRNSLPFQVGSTSSPSWGTSSRTLAAGRPGSSPVQLRPAERDADQMGGDGLAGDDVHRPQRRRFSPQAHRRGHPASVRASAAARDRHPGAGRPIGFG